MEQIDGNKESASLNRLAIIVGLLLSAVGAYPTLQDWVSPKQGVLFVHRDYFVAYAPGEPLGFKTDQLPVPSLERRLTATKLPSPPFLVTTEDGRPINGIIYDVQLSLWNAGGLEIGRDKIRRDIKFSFAGADIVLGARVLYAKPEDGLKTVLDKENKTLTVSWDYLDPGSGFKIAVVFNGPNPTAINWSGYIDGKIEDANTNVFARLRWKTAVAFLCAVMVILFIVLLVTGFTPAFVSISALTFVGLVAYSAVFYVHQILRLSYPPF